jgi:hypothetical protein
MRPRDSSPPNDLDVLLDGVSHTPGMSDRQLSDAQIALLDHLYQENVKIAAAFWDWRHKLMAFTFTVVSALAAVGTWATTRQVSPFAVAGAFLIASVLSLSTALLNRRTGDIVNKTYAAGAALETAIKEQLAGELGDAQLMFTLMQIDGAPVVSPGGIPARVLAKLQNPRFGWVLSAAYAFLSVAFLLTAVAVIVLD